MNLVRIKDPDSGHEVTVGARYAAALGITPLDKPAVDSQGNALPAKHRVELGSTPVAATRARPPRPRWEKTPKVSPTTPRATEVDAAPSSPAQSEVTTDAQEGNA